MHNAHNAPQGRAEFERWFAGSKVVDRDGRPLVVYHGTQAVFSEFDAEMQGTTVWFEDVGFFFTNDPKEASSYAILDWDKPNPQPNVKMVFLAIKNPMIIRLEHEQSPYDSPARWYDHEGREAVEQAELNGQDGLIVIDEREDFLLVNGMKPTLFVALRPDQIKDALTP